MYQAKNKRSTKLEATIREVEDRIKRLADTQENDRERKRQERSLHQV